ncbi:hypothetical protein AGMMS49974_05350 [Deltaproteobacteria bacterium]|nr:hypothetical protein AGMMS49925_05150 [Deltaproteobacteria bacterium]GHU94934.1 hypothetical protein AGMMS49974_05350 [Deltaproteobacteria bacterium]GHU98358.1 hypothetical protein AGMMS50248_04810 [Deltaproteobacteria bacterium]
MLEHTEKHPTDAAKFFLVCFCRRALFEDVGAILEAKGCVIKQTATEQKKDRRRVWL